MLLDSISTAGSNGSNSYVLKITRSGANAQLLHSAYGISSVVTNTNVTSGHNIAGYFSASGATTSNLGIWVDAGVTRLDGQLQAGDLATYSITPDTNYQIHVGFDNDSGGGIRITNSDADSSGTVGPLITLEHLKATPAQGDILGAINFNGQDSTDADTTYGTIRSVLGSATNGTETANLQFITSIGGSSTTMAEIGSGALSAIVGVKGYLAVWVADDNKNASLGTLPANSCVTAIHVDVIEEFTDTANDDAVTVGYDADSDSLLKSLNLDGIVAGTDITIVEGHASEGDDWLFNATSRALEVYVTGTNGDAAAGKALVVVEYMIVPAQIA